MKLFGGAGEATAAPDVPNGMRIAGAWAWRIVAIAVAAGIAMWVIAQLRIVVIPLLIAALLTALLLPIVTGLSRHRWPRGLAVAVAVLVALVVVSGLAWISIAQIRAGYPDLEQRALSSWVSLKAMLLDSPLHVTDADLTGWASDVWASVQRDTQTILSSAISVGSSLGAVVTGALLTVFSTIFLLLDGRGIWRWITRIFPTRARAAVDGAGRAGWVTLGNFVRVQMLVAAIDAVGIGLGALFMGMPLAVPVAILVFLGSFIPVIGAIATGVLAVVIALITLGPIHAIVMLGVVLLVQQVESHILQPLIMGNAVKVHPLAVVLSVAGGSVIAGIAGALFAVPIVAFVNVFVKTIASGSWRTSPTPTAKDVE